jgi:hypothetical protein
MAYGQDIKIPLKAKIFCRDLFSSESPKALRRESLPEGFMPKSPGKTPLTSILSPRGGKGGLEWTNVVYPNLLLF